MVTAWARHAVQQTSLGQYCCRCGRPHPPLTSGCACTCTCPLQRQAAHNQSLKLAPAPPCPASPCPNTLGSSQSPVGCLPPTRPSVPLPVGRPHLVARQESEHVVELPLLHVCRKAGDEHLRVHWTRVRRLARPWQRHGTGRSSSSSRRRRRWRQQLQQHRKQLIITM